jgi:hypothetical protein
MSELEALERDTSAWTIAADGNHVRRSELLELIVTEAREANDPLAALIDSIKADSRKSFSKAKLLELIEEFRP